VKIFVAGSTGVLGRRVVPLLVEAGHEVRALARSDARAALLRRLGAEPVGVDVFDGDALRGALEGSEVVCNLATHIPPTSRMAVPGAWAQNDRIRAEASRNLVDGALAGGAQRYVQESIAFLYRDGRDQWIDESSPIDPVANLVSATVAEANAARVTAAGATGVILRFAAFYGPDSDATLDMIRLAKRRIALGAAPNAYVSSITTDDAAGAVLASLSAPAGLYNVGDDEPVTRREFFSCLAGALGVRPPFVAPAGLAKLGGAKASVLTRSQRVSNRKFVAATGWRPAHRSVREGWPVVVAGSTGPSQEQFTDTSRRRPSDPR
jgi:nucleoside-diphosphate-sugar epimerase